MQPLLCFMSDHFISSWRRIWRACWQMKVSWFALKLWFSNFNKTRIEQRALKTYGRKGVVIFTSHYQFRMELPLRFCFTYRCEQLRALRHRHSPFTGEEGQGIHVVSPHELQIPMLCLCTDQCRRPCKAWYPHNIRVVCSSLLKTRAQSGSLSFWLVCWLFAA